MTRYRTSQPISVIEPIDNVASIRRENVRLRKEEKENSQLLKMLNDGYEADRDDFAIRFAQFLHHVRQNEGMLRPISKILTEFKEKQK